MKEAHREQNEFLIDSSPISLYEDYEFLITEMTKGRSFSKTVANLNLPQDRIRHAVNYRGVDKYASKTVLCSQIVINGDAENYASYQVEKDIFYMDNNFSGIYEPNKPLIWNDEITRNADVYGLEGKKAYCHSIVFDISFAEPIPDPLVFELTADCLTNVDQTVEFYVNDEYLRSPVLQADKAYTIQIPLPELKNRELQIEMRLPDAVLKPLLNEVLHWNEYDSIEIQEAIIKQIPISDGK